MSLRTELIAAALIAVLWIVLLTQVIYPVISQAMEF